MEGENMYKRHHQMVADAISLIELNCWAYLFTDIVAEVEALTFFGAVAFHTRPLAA